MERVAVTTKSSFKTTSVCQRGKPTDGPSIAQEEGEVSPCGSPRHGMTDTRHGTTGGFEQRKLEGEGVFDAPPSPAENKKSPTRLSGRRWRFGGISTTRAAGASLRSQAPVQTHFDRKTVKQGDFAFDAVAHFCKEVGLLFLENLLQKPPMIYHAGKEKKHQKNRARNAARF
jgi:hypothetical protein